MGGACGHLRPILGLVAYIFPQKAARDLSKLRANVE